MKEFLTLQEAVELTAYGDLSKGAERWRSEQAQAHFLQILGGYRKIFFPILGKLRSGRLLERIGGLSPLFFFERIPEAVECQGTVYSFQLFGHNTNDDFINISELCYHNENSIILTHIKRLFFTDKSRSGVIALDNSNPVRQGSFLCYTDIIIPAADFQKAFPQIVLSDATDGENLENQNSLEVLKAKIEHLPVEEKEAEIAALKNGTPATSGQNNNLPAVAKPARPFVLNLIKTGYPNGEFKNWKREAIATEVFDRAKAARYEEKDIPAVSTIIRHYFK